MRSANQFKTLKSCVPFPLKPCVVGVLFLFGSACSMQSVAASSLKDGHVVIHNDQNIEGEEGLHEEVSEGDSIEISNSANLNISGSAGIQAVTHGDASSDTAGDITITTSDKSDIAADHDGISASSNGESGDILIDVQGKLPLKKGMQSLPIARMAISLSRRMVILAVIYMGFQPTTKARVMCY